MSNRRSISRSKQPRRHRLLAGIEQLENRSLLAAFVPGNIAVYRVGNGVQTLTASGNAVFVDEYTPSGSLVQSIPLAADTVNPGNANTLIADGTQIAEGMLTLAADGKSLAVPGYNPTGTFDRDLSVRVVGLIDIGGGVDLSTTGNFNKNNSFRSAFRNGNQVYTGGGAGGVVMVTKGTSSGSTTITTSPAQTRSVFVYAGQLYLSTSSGSTVRVGSVGNGTPTTTGQTTTNLPGFPTTGSPYQFFFADLSGAVAGVDTLYVADDTTSGGQIQKYSLSGGTWTAQGVISAPAVRGLTGVVSGNSVTLYAATGSNQSAGGGSLYTFTDTAGYNASVSGTATTIASAGAKTAFRGVALVPDDGIGLISGTADSATYVAGMDPVLIGDGASFSDQSSFKGGSSTIRFISGGTSDDTLSIAQGNGIVADSGVVLYNGTQIGTYPVSGSGSGLSGNQLTISFNGVLSSDSVGSAAVQALLRQIGFGTGGSAAAGDRHIGFAVRQNDGRTATAEITVSVTPPNQAPVANDADVATDEDQAKNITLTGSDADGDSLSYVVMSGPTHGSLSGTAPNLTYAPDANFHGADSFTFTVSDGQADSNEATIRITVDSVNDSPTAESDDLATDEDEPLQLMLLATDADGDSLTYTILDVPAHGQLSGSAPDLTYTPDANYHGSDSFTFVVDDGTDQSIVAAVGLTVSSLNDAPVLDPGLSPELDAIVEDATDPAGTRVSQLLIGFSDADAEASQGIAIFGISSSGDWQYSLDDGANWLPIGNPSESAAILLRDTDRVRFVPAPDFYGTSSFDFIAWDQTDAGSAGSAVNLVNNRGGSTAYSNDWDTALLTIAAVNDPPVIANFDRTANYTENDPPVAVLSDGTTVTDPDSSDFQGGKLTVVTTARGSIYDIVSIADQGTGSGQMSLSGSTVLYEGVEIGVFSGGTNGAPLVVSFSSSWATSAAAEALLRAITFHNISNNPYTLTRTIKFTLTDDDGGTSNLVFQNISVVAVNDAPTIVNSANSASYTENSSPLPILSDGTMVSDQDSSNFQGGKLTVVTTAHGSSFDVVSIANQGTGAGQIGVSGSTVFYGGVAIGVFGGGTNGAPLGVYFAGSAATSAAAQALLRAITFHNVSDNPYTPTRTFRFTLTDGDGGTSNLVFQDVAVLAVNDAPVIANFATTTSYTENDPPVAILSSDATVTDPDSANFSGGKLTVATTANGSVFDIVSIANQGTGAGQIGLSGSTVLYGGVSIGVFGGGTNGAPLGVYFYGSAATPAAVQALLRAITFHNVSDNPYTRTRTVRFTLTDGDGGTSNLAEQEIAVHAI